MADNTTTTQATGAEERIESVRATLAFVGDRIALLTDIVTGDGLERRGDFSLSARGAEAVAEMLVEMGARLDEAQCRMTETLDFLHNHLGPTAETKGTKS